ncbi:ACT domain-containing protein, partial [Wenyingzhuangia sp. 1_MG-2023]|nr:ACT domain-containing protein [Wenyingzhuangia sp. 1_MG-2023]
MTLSLVLTVIADDKPGIVETIAAVISRHHGNWTESHLANLAGKFAGIILVTLKESAAANELQTELAALASQGIEIRAEAGLPDHRSSHHLNLSLVGNDRPGIVQAVSRVLATLEVNVLELSSECAQAEMSALSLF